LFAKKLALAAITAAIAAVGVTGVAQAVPQAGDICQVNPNSSGWDITHSWGVGAYFEPYKVYYPDSVHFVGKSWGLDSGYYGTVYWAYTDGNPTGDILRTAINESTCHQ
jgi:hypothetical protein